MNPTPYADTLKDFSKRGIIMYSVTPVAKPRMTRRDTWKQRKCVMKYRDYCDRLRALNAQIENGCSITFILPMPESWSKRKKELMAGKPHEQRPDIDNLCKGYMDALLEEDSRIHTLGGLRKRWGHQGEIHIMLGEVDA